MFYGLYKLIATTLAPYFNASIAIDGEPVLYVHHIVQTNLIDTIPTNVDDCIPSWLKIIYWNCTRSIG
jgi:hypothetical protein